MSAQNSSQQEGPSCSDGDSTKDTQEFIRAICGQIAKGYGFVPLVGAGFSAPSGAPLVYDLEDYLQRCVCLALGLDSEKPQEDKLQPWNPRADQWPPFVDRSRVFDRRFWVERVLEEISELRKPSKNAEDKSDKKYELEQKIQIVSQGYGAMQEWRGALEFLSRLVRGRRGTEDAKTARLGVSQQDVIDACFREALKNKFPTLGHRMLGALAGAMRIDIVLTTNFDNLLEQAFDAARNPLEVFEVQLEGRLPDWSTLANTRALVKLHGGRSSLRADYTLDESPSEEDERTFLRYLLSPKGRQEYRNNPEATRQNNLNKTSEGFGFQNHLLVLGFSANDNRIREFIKYAWKRLGDEFQVYWVCYSDSDVKTINKLIRESCKERGVSEEGAKELCRSTILRHTQAGLLLLQLYQSLRRTLPPLGSIFPSVARLAIPPLEPAWITSKLADNENVAAFTDALKTNLKSSKKTGSKIDRDNAAKKNVFLVYSSVETSGAISLCARVFRAMEKEKVCLWIDMNDVSSAENLFEALLEAIYYRLGLEDWIPPTIGRRADAAGGDARRGREIDRLLKSVNKEWVVFLNCYETPGANAPGIVIDDASVGNGWLDNEKPSENDSLPFEDHSGCGEDMIALLQELSGEESRMSVVLVCRPDTRFTDLARAKFGGKVNELKAGANGSNTPFFVERNVVEAALRWTNKEDERQRRRFLHALILMQRPRHLSTLWSSALSPQDSDLPGSKQLDWLRELEDERVGLIRRKPGGLIWIYSHCRQTLRKILTNEANSRDALPDDIQAMLMDWNPSEQEPEIHKEIAEWYEKMLDASEAPAAVFEAAHHFGKAALAFLKANRYGRSNANIDAATSLLRSNAFLIQTHGYSRGSCRRLNEIAKIGMELFRAQEKIERSNLKKKDANEVAAIKESLRQLWVVCAEIMRAVAREVGEDAKAYYRHRQAGRLAFLDTTWEAVCPDEENEELGKKLRGLYGSRGKDWLRWRRWSGMLAIASRSYPQAQAIFEKELGPFAKQKEYNKQKDGGLADSKEANIYLLLNDQAERLEALRLMEQSVELMLLQSIVIRRRGNLERLISDAAEKAQGAEASEKEQSAKILAYADDMIRRAVKLAQKVRDSDRSADSHEVVRANWCEIRLLMHLSMVESRRKMLGLKTTQALDPMGILGDAEAKIRVSDLRRFRSELALIDLHRADVKLCEAETMDLRKGTSGSAIRLPFLSRESEIFFSLEPEERKRAFEDLRARIDLEKLALAGALAADSIRFLNRAEPALRDRRRNVWWTTWFFERKLRAIALSVAASMFDSGAPIPFLGLEAAMRVTESEADHLLNDASRMIRVDAYRLASVIEIYIACIQALRMRLSYDACSNPEYIDLPRRLEKMLANLREALAALEVAWTNRTELKNHEEQGALDPDVKEYTEKVKEYAKAYLALKENKAYLSAYEALAETQALRDTYNDADLAIAL